MSGLGVAAAIAGILHFWPLEQRRIVPPPPSPPLAVVAEPVVTLAVTPSSGPPGEGEALLASGTVAGLAGLKLEATLTQPKERTAAKGSSGAATGGEPALPPLTLSRQGPWKPASDPSPAPAEPVTGQASIDRRPHAAVGNEAAENGYRRAMAAVRRGSVTEAMSGLQGVLRLDSRHVSARQALLSLLLEQQQWSEAQATMEDGLNLDPAQVGWAMALARLQLEKGKLAEAADTLARHAGHADQNPEYQAFFALVLQKQKRPAEAADHYRAALALRPAESRWWYGLGLVLEGDRKAAEAREAFRKARETGNLPAELATAVEQHLR